MYKRLRLYCVQKRKEKAIKTRIKKLSYQNIMLGLFSHEPLPARGSSCIGIPSWSRIEPKLSLTSNKRDLSYLYTLINRWGHIWPYRLTSSGHVQMSSLQVQIKRRWMIDPVADIGKLRGHVGSPLGPITFFPLLYIWRSHYYWCAYDHQCFFYFHLHLTIDVCRTYGCKGLNACRWKTRLGRVNLYLKSILTCCTCIYWKESKPLRPGAN